MNDNEVSEVEIPAINVPLDLTKAALKERLNKDGLNYGKIGIVGTLSYLILIAWILYYNDVDLGFMAPNEWGDFLAGIFGPLALFWVVIGFWQQGAELRNSRDALRLQAKELESSVVAQQDQVNALYAQIDSSREIWEQEQTAEFKMSEPRLRLQVSGSSGEGQNSRRFKFDLRNVGERCSDLKVRFQEISEFQDGDTSDEIRSIPIMANSDRIELQLLLPTDREYTAVIVTIEYADKSGREQVRYFIVEMNGATLRVRDPNGQSQPPSGRD